MKEQEIEKELPFKFSLDSYQKAFNGMSSVRRSMDYDFGESFSSRLANDDPDRINSIIQSGSLSEKRDLSRRYFDIDGYYKQIVIYYATLLKYAGLLIPSPGVGKNLSASHIQKRYHSAMDLVEAMNIPEWLTNCACRVLVDGCYYGLRLETKKTQFTVIDLPPEYCRSRFKDPYGNDLIEFNLSYFDQFKQEELPSILDAYPKEMARAYKRAKRLNDPWYVIPSEYGICIPMFEGKPPFINVIPKILEYGKAIDLDLKRSQNQTKKIIVQKIPHLSDGRLLFEPPEAEVFHKGAVNMLRKNDDVDVLTTYADVDVISSTSEQKNGEQELLTRIEQNIYAQGGLSGQLFASTTGQGLVSSLNDDLALMMIFANKSARVIGNIINAVWGNSNVTFKYIILPVTYNNTDDFIENAFKLVGSGYSFLMPSVAMGISQRDLGNLKDLETKILKLDKKLKPLQTAYTQSGKAAGEEDEGGRPEKKEEEKTDKTVENEESDKTGGS